MLIDDDLVPVRKTDITLGQPMPWPVYDKHRNLLMNRGVLITSMSQVEGLLSRGLYRDRRYAGLKPARELPEAVEEAEADKATSAVALEELRLTPGDVLQLQPLLEGSTERFSVRLIGYTRGKSLLVTAPEIDGKLIHVRDGQTFRVRAFSGLLIGSFTTRVLKNQFNPYPYLHLAYPNIVQAMRLRKSMRAPANAVTAVYDREEGAQIAAGIITDISVGGARIEGPKIMGKKDENVFLSFKLKLPDIEEYVKANAVIRSITEGEDEAGKRQYVHGVQFEGLESRYQLVIANLVYRHLHKDAV